MTRVYLDLATIVEAFRSFNQRTRFYLNHFQGVKRLQSQELSSTLPDTTAWCFNDSLPWRIWRSSLPEDLKQQNATVTKGITLLKCNRALTPHLTNHLMFEA
jgi:hypothetical protein